MAVRFLRFVQIRRLIRWDRRDHSPEVFAPNAPLSFKQPRYGLPGKAGKRGTSATAYTSFCSILAR
jgi:hypothetical protein